MTTTADTTQQDGRNLRVVGTRPVRHDGVEKVTGRARYAADINLPGMLYGKILRSPHAHARIVSIDTSKAEALPGVRAVLTGRGLPSRRRPAAGLLRDSRHYADRGRERNGHRKGHVQGPFALAAVAADSPHVAEEAVSLIDVEYEVLPAALTVQDAMKEDAPLLLNNLTTRYREQRMGMGEDTGVRSNVADHIQFKRGDLEQGFAEADIIVEKEFTTKTVHQGYIEPQSSTGLWSSDGRITIWTATQGSFMIRASTAAILGVPESTVRIIPTEIGGGFGGKQTPYLDPIVALLSRKTGRPVKIAMTRREVFEGTGPGSGTHHAMQDRRHQ